MLYGRRRDRALIAALCADARKGHSGVLLIRGEAGVGKSSLLQEAADRAGDLYLLQVTGVESEVELAYAALQHLLQPILDRLGRLPPPQADALRVAFGLAESKPNRFLAQLATLGLLAEIAREQPALCLIDDAQWLDRPSADALLFAARRLRDERIVVLLAACDSDPHQLHAPGLPEVHLAGLDAQAGRQLLQERVGGIAPHVCDWLIRQAGGNPLALLELPASLTGEQLAGREPLPERPTLSIRLQRTFLRRLRGVPEATRTLLLVAAAEDTGELATVLAACEAVGVDPRALEPAERADLLRITGQELRFRHPLVRSAVYQSATFAARQAAHRALAQVLDGERHVDRRAWHLAAAGTGLDESVASALEESAGRARRRGGAAVAAVALERAAALTPDAVPRARRLVAAAENVWEAGRPQQAKMLLDQVAPLATHSSVRAGIARVCGAVELGAGTPAVACALLVDGAEPILGTEPRKAAEMLVLATRGALNANALERIVDRIGPAMLRLPGQDGARLRPIAESLIRFARGHLTPASDAGGRPPAPVAIRVTSDDDPRLQLWPAILIAELVEGDVAAYELCARTVAIHRADGKVSSLALALANLAAAEVALGRWSAAIDTATKGLRLARETGQKATAGEFLVTLASIATLRGRAEDARLLADQALACAIPRRIAMVAAAASWIVAKLDLAAGRPAAALDRLLALMTRNHPTTHAVIARLATSDLVEAAARANSLAGVKTFTTRLEQWARWDGRPWAWVVTHRCRALASGGKEAEGHFQAALAVDGIGERPFELARTELLYGEWLRRRRRRADARTHLRAAVELFERLGAAPWTERARSELRASGETARNRTLGAFFQLTPQELRIARLAGRGLTNREIAAQLFLSPHTVGYHLHKIFSKLGIASRGDLRELDLGDGVTP
ncbi:MAG TPA: AAA family ATPase [Actinomycetes bacterium]|nr:AAA family ATPase [Actinomycetes bacterium]